MKKMIYSLRLITIFLAISQQTFAQTARIIGSVKDSNGLPLQGASVFLKNKKSGTVTDSNGHYELTVKTGEQTIVASFVGYAEQEKKISPKAGTVIEGNFTKTELYMECAEVIVICSPDNGGAILNMPFVREGIKVNGKKIQN